MPPGASLWHSLLVRHAKSLREVLSRASQALEGRLATGQPQAKLETILVRNTPRQPLHPIARIRQTQSRWFSTARRSIDAATARHFSSGRTAGPKYDRASFPKSRVGAYINQSSGRAPFASTLRPNLTGGTLGRTAGGYTLGSGRVGGVRYFSHGPACQAHVVQNVSQAVRAFFISGQKAQFNGTSPRTGEKRYRAVSSLQDAAGRKMRSVPLATPGSTLRYTINPTITALTPLAAVVGYSSSEHDAADHLNTEGLLDALSVDFSRALKELAAVLNDLRRLSSLGNLPITSQGSTLQIHFPGCDAETVERLCDELQIQRGTVVQDESFDAFAGTEIALLFPFAPSEDGSDVESLYDEYLPPTKISPRQRYPIDIDDMLTPSSPAFSTQSDSGFDASDGLFSPEDVLLEAHSWSDESPTSSSRPQTSSYSSERGVEDRGSPLEYQGFEGIYRFLEELDGLQQRR